MGKRLDITLYERGLVRSRSAASEIIQREGVLVNGKVAMKASQLIKETDILEVTKPLAYVSRGGEKLEAALTAFSLPTKDITALDVGSSTGGFTDCLLQNGAKKVFAVDVGTDQFSSELRDDKRVHLMEKTDIRTAILPYPVDLIVIDVSFISLSEILEKCALLLAKNGSIIALIKPQFEVGKEKIGRGGIVKNEADRLEVIERIREKAQSLNLKEKGLITSPISGGDGNIEYLIWLTY